MHDPRPPAHVRRDERGFTLIEVLIVSTVCLVGLMAVISTFDSSRRLVSAAERTEVVSHRAERELERALALPYEQVGLRPSPAPVHSADPDSPNHLVTSAGQYQWSSSQPAANFVMTGVLEHTTPWSDDASRLNGTVYRYVTEYDDPSLPAAVDGKRVTVAVTATNRRRAVTTTTIIRNEG